MMMKAWYLDSQSGLSALRLVDDAPVPTPAAGQLLVRTLTAALNPADRYLAEKQYPAKPSFPHILGRDACGVVEKVGEGVTEFSVGDRIILLRSEVGVSTPGAFADYFILPVESAAKAPAGWTDAESAAGPLVYLTAHQALTMWGAVEPGVVLVTGASGGVGLASIHLARAFGHRVIGLSRGAGKVQDLMQQGADLVIDPADADFVRKVREFAGKAGVAIAVDNVGGSGFNDLLDVMGFGGRISCVGRLAGTVPEFNTAKLFFRRLRIGGVAAGTCTPEEARKTWAQIVALLNEANRKPLIDSEWPFEMLLEAFARLKEGPLGKVILRVGA
jgi:NADPH2:quinone reductase